MIPATNPEQREAALRGQAAMVTTRPATIQERGLDHGRAEGDRRRAVHESPSMSRRRRGKQDHELPTPHQGPRFRVAAASRQAAQSVRDWLRQARSSTWSHEGQRLDELTAAVPARRRDGVPPPAQLDHPRHRERAQDDADSFAASSAVSAGWTEKRAVAAMQPRCQGGPDGADAQGLPLAQATASAGTPKRHTNWPRQSQHAKGGATSAGKARTSRKPRRARPRAARSS